MTVTFDLAAMLGRIHAEIDATTAVEKAPPRPTSANSLKAASRYEGAVTAR